MDLLLFLDKIEDSIKSGLPKKAAIIGKDVVALITHRVTQKGEDENGDKFSNYSEKKYYASSYKGKSRSQQAEQKLINLQPKKISYREFRSVNNLNTSPKNFLFTGEMWRNVDVTEVKEEGSEVIIVIDGRDELTRNKIKGNEKREGKNILAISRKEERIIQGSFQEWLNDLINVRLSN